MLKRFSVENFSSFRDRSVLDLTAGRGTENTNHCIDFSSVKLLKSAVIYGANASGKSNFIKAIDFARQVVMQSLDDVETYKKYFRLDLESENSSSRFEFEIEIENRFFSYGFMCSLRDKKVNNEWLYEIGTGKPVMIFERTENDINFGKLISNDKDLSNRFGIYSADMKNQSSQLFLSEIASKAINDSDLKDAQIINELYKWIKTKLIIIYPQSKFLLPFSSSDDDGVVDALTKYLVEFDTGIQGISTIEDPLEDNKEIPDDLRSMVERDLKEPDAKVMAEINNTLLNFYKKSDGTIFVQKLGLIHSENNKEVFELKDESDGTRRLFDLIPLIARFKINPTIIIDEFDRSLHPKLTKQFFDLFLSQEESKSQLIISTHESTLLDLNLLRRDEIWFVEKDQTGASKLFTLNQFKVRYDTKVDKAYLLGRYGAIPFFKQFEGS